MTDRIRLLELSFATTAGILEDVKPDQLGWPTPCTQWALRDLIAHMLSVLAEMGRAARGESAEEFGVIPAKDVAVGFRAEARRTLDAWQSIDPEMTIDIGFGPVSAAFAMNVNMCDTAVHGWDVARTLGCSADIPDELALHILEFEQQILDDNLRQAVGFSSPLEIGTNAGASDRLVAFLGRRP